MGGALFTLTIAGLAVAGLLAAWLGRRLRELDRLDARPDERDLLELVPPPQTDWAWPDSDAAVARILEAYADALAAIGAAQAERARNRNGTKPKAGAAK